MKKTFVASCLFVLCLVPSTFAAEATNKAAAETQKPKGIHFETATCGDLLDIFAAADPKLNKDEKMLKGAQERAFTFVAWTHGYLNGRDGVDPKRYPFSQEGVTQLVGTMYKTCKDNDSKLFFEAIKEMR